MSNVQEKTLHISKKRKKIVFIRKNRILVKHLMEVLNRNYYKHRTTVNCYMHTHKHVRNCLKLFYIAIKSLKKV